MAIDITSHPHRSATINETIEMIFTKVLIIPTFLVSCHTCGKAPNNDTISPMHEDASAII